MKNIFKYIIILSYLGTFGQEQKNIGVYDPDKLELKENISFIGKDTLVINKYENGQILSKGKYALNKSGEMTYLKIGNWIQYYRNGNVQSEGNYQISSYLDCGPGGLQRIYYNYKFGSWKYFSEHSILEAHGNYIIFKSHIDTSCEGGDDLIFMKPNSKWIFPKVLDDDLSIRINSVIFSDGFNDYQYQLKDGNKVIWTMKN